MWPTFSDSSRRKKRSSSRQVPGTEASTSSDFVDLQHFLTSRQQFYQSYPFLPIPEGPDGFQNYLNSAPFWSHPPPLDWFRAPNPSSRMMEIDTVPSTDYSSNVSMSMSLSSMSMAKASASSMCGSNRRKQTKPNRLSGNEGTNENAPVLESTAMPEEVSTIDNNHELEEIDNETVLVTQKTELEEAILESHCDSEPTDMVELNRDVNSTEVADVPEEASTLPSKISEVMAEGCKPPVSKQTVNNLKLSSDSKPDSYCDICEKNFCNKYYLKKHKADVHGISADGTAGTSTPGQNQPNSYRKRTENTTVSSSLPPVSMPNMSSVVNPLLSMPPPMNMSMNPFQTFFLNPFALSSMSLPQSFLPNPMQSYGMLGGKLPDAKSMDLSLGMNALMNQSRTSPVPNKKTETTPDPNSDAYCHLCQKNVCSKYFLKMHMANLHNIKDFKLPNESENEAMNLSDSKRSPSPTDEQIWNLSGNRDSPDKLLDFKCILCPSAFASPLELRLHVASHHPSFQDMNSYMNLALPPPTAVNSSPPMEKNEPMVPQQNHPRMDQFQNSMVAAKLADRVVCDICNKEVCNKYFLKTHKEKVHGISRDLQKSSNNNTSSHNNNNNSGQKPLLHHDIFTAGNISLPKNQDSSEAVNLADIASLVYNGSLNQSNLGKLDLSNLKWAPNTFNHTSPAQQRVRCDICNKEVCNKYFLKQHKQNLHGITTSSISSPASCDPDSNGVPESVECKDMIPCPECGLLCPSRSQLTRHLQQSHPSLSTSSNSLKRPLDMDPSPQDLKMSRTSSTPMSLAPLNLSINSSSGQKHNGPSSDPKTEGTSGSPLDALNSDSEYLSS